MSTDGVEDFWYLLNEPLLNYGSYIVLGLLNHAFPSSGDQVHLEPPKYEDAMCSSHPRTFVNESNRGEHKVSVRGDDFQPLPQPGSFPETPRSLPTGPPKTVDSEDVQLRAQIHAMGANLSNDPSVLPWSEVGGLAPAKARLEEFAASFLHFSHLVANLRHQSATGILLSGPQGTGKTLLAKAFAKKYNFTFYDIRASAMMSKYMGEAEKFIRALFEEVKGNAPAVLLLDECDGLLCRLSMDGMMGQSYRTLQTELKNQWSDLIYSKAKVVVIGATNKPHDIDMDGFGRRLSLKLYIHLPNALACQRILGVALERVRHQVKEIEMVALGETCHERGLSGFDIDCVVEGLVRKGLRSIMVSEWFVETEWEDEVIVVPATEADSGARPCSWEDVEDKTTLSYRPFPSEDISFAIHRYCPTVDPAMIERHEDFARQYCISEVED
ncbi:MAG: hypothetical protein L6R40_002877 [Gallowayella cf. fulva]|nr:MAG: hypothetical protein L6R40_002877 [Xanthomendoza cf. fulva]